MSEEHPLEPPRAGTEGGGSATDALLGPNPFVGLTTAQIAAAIARVGAQAVRRPDVVTGAVSSWFRENVSVVRDTSTVAPDDDDHRFHDPVWSANPALRRLLRHYLVTRRCLLDSVDDLAPDWKSAERARFGMAIGTEALAPTNLLLTNPTAIREARDTGGASIVRGLRAMWADATSNGFMPSMVDPTPFEVGGNLASTPGAVVLRNEVCELIQYSPVAERVRQRPVVLIPSQINKYYIMDLEPGRSFAEFAVAQGIQLFIVSWRNPTPAHRDWDFGTYVKATIDALEAAAAICRTDSVNVMGMCAGGVTATLTAAHLAAERSQLVHSLTLCVAMLDTAPRSLAGALTSERSARAATTKSRRRGVVTKHELNRAFAWMRPNDLVWGFWVNNYLMGRPPPQNPVLYWNHDAIALPAALHAQFVDLVVRNPLVSPGTLSVLGTPIDLTSVTSDAYVLGGRDDHIVPWESCHRTARLLGGTTRFILGTAGHIQSLVNPPGVAKSRFLDNSELTADPKAWLAGADEHTGTWWTDWCDWVSVRSGPLRSAPRRLGSRRFPALEPAPGSYVRQQ